MLKNGLSKYCNSSIGLILFYKNLFIIIMFKTAVDNDNWAILNFDSSMCYLLSN